MPGIGRRAQMQGRWRAWRLTVHGPENIEASLYEEKESTDSKF